MGQDIPLLFDLRITGRTCEWDVETYTAIALEEDACKSDSPPTDWRYDGCWGKKGGADRGRQGGQ